MLVVSEVKGDHILVLSIYNLIWKFAKFSYVLSNLLGRYYGKKMRSLLLALRFYTGDDRNVWWPHW